MLSLTHIDKGGAPNKTPISTWIDVKDEQKTIRQRTGYPTVTLKVVVLDLHIFYDNRINKHIDIVRQRYDVYRINFNFFHGREVKNTRDYQAHILNCGRTGNQYVNGMFFTMSTLLGMTTRRLQKVLREEFVKEGDEILFHVHDPYLLIIAMGLRKRFSGSKVVFDRHDHFETWKNRLGISVPGIFERMYGKKITELIIANPGVENLPKVYSGKTVTQISNYPLEKYFDRDAVDKKIERLVSDGDICLAYFGALSLDFDRDIDLMLKLMGSVMNDNEKVRCVVAGRIFEPAVVGRLDRMKEEFGERFRYLGELPYDQVIENSKRSHIGFFLLNPNRPTWSPSRPYSANKIYEYLQTGTVPVVRAIIEEPEGIRDCSLFFDERSTYEEMLSSLGKLCRDQERICALMLKCYEIGTNYSWEKMGPRYLACYERIFSANAR